VTAAANRYAPNGKSLSNKVDMNFSIADAQRVLAELGLGGWLLYDFQGQNPTARQAIGIGALHLTRRWFYFIPVEGQPTLLVHHIERAQFPALPGQQHVFSSKEEMGETLAALLRGRTAVAMEYFPMGSIPYLSRVDAGTVELVRSFGPEVRSSHELVTQLLCTWNDEQYDTHRRAAEALSDIRETTFAWVGEQLRAGVRLNEMDVQNKLLEGFAAHALVTDHPPIAATRAHAGDPHYAPNPAQAFELQPNSVLLIDLWAKFDQVDAAYGDLTYMAWIGPEPAPPRIDAAFRAVLGGRDAALNLIRSRFESGQPVQGWEADRAARDFIAAAGFGQAFTHRTGHNLGFASAHGDGPQLDDLETHDERTLTPRVGFTIEPGAYLPDEDFGIRSEINVYMDPVRGPIVNGEIQTDWMVIEPLP